MDSQFTQQVQAWDQTQSFHYTWPEHSAVADICISARYDHNDWAVPLAEAIAVFTRWTAGGSSTTAEGLTHAFAANDLSEVEGVLIADNCYSGAVINVYFYPVVFPG